MIFLLQKTYKFIFIGALFLLFTLNYVLAEDSFSVNLVRKFRRNIEPPLNNLFPSLNPASSSEDEIFSNGVKPGEKIDYSIQWLGIDIGTAKLNFLGKTTLNDQEAIFVTSKTETLEFSGFDKIYGDPITYYPLQVERDIIIGGKEVSILEEYDRKQNLLTITRISDKKTQEQITKGPSKLAPDSGRIQNVILLIYWLRSQNLKVGDSFSITLPTSQYKLCVVREEEVVVPLGKFNAYLLETEPEKIRLWIETTNRKLPLRIENAIFLTNSAMVITDVSSEKPF